MRSIKLTPEQIESWVARHFEYKRRKNGDELLICNPFIYADDKFKFNICTVAKKSKKSKYSNYWVHDWRPSAQQYNGSFIKFVQRYKGLGFKDALKDICGDDIDLKNILRPIEPQQQIVEPFKRIQLPTTAKALQRSDDSKLKTAAVNYLKKRGIFEPDIISFRLHYTPTKIIFPYIEYDDIVYWQGRSFSDSIKEFEFPDERAVGIGKSQFIYGFDNAEPGQPVFVVEAIFCALTLGPGGLATGGATMSADQVRKIRALNPAYVVLAPDNDKEGLASLYKNWKLLNPYFMVRYVLPPKPFKDWNDYIRSKSDKQLAIKEIRKYATKNAKNLKLSDAIKFRVAY
jgi:DNA primase